MASLLASIVLFYGHYCLIHAVGYSSSVLGSLIGADLLHPRRSRRSTTSNQHKWCHEFDGMFVSRLLSSSLPTSSYSSSDVIYDKTEKLM